MTYLGQTVFCERPNFTELEAAMMDDFRLASVGFGKATPWKDGEELRRTVRLPFLFDTAREQKCYRIRRSLMRERMLGFWLPLYLNDFRMVSAPVAGSYELTVADTGLRHRLTEAGQFRHLAIVTSTTMDLYGIDRVDLHDGNEVIVLTETIKRTGTLYGSICCAVMFARFAEDDISFDNLTDQVSSCTDSFVELPKETLEPPRHVWVRSTLSNDFATALGNWAAASYGGGTCNSSIVGGAARFQWTVGGTNEQIRNTAFDATNFQAGPNEGMFDNTNGGNTSGARYASATVTVGATSTIAFWWKGLTITDVIPVSLNSDGFASGPNLMYTAGVWAWNTGDAGANAFVTGSANVADNQWHFVVITNSAANGAKMFVDGVQVGSSATYRNPTTTAALFMVGAFHGGGNNAYGMFKRVALWGKELTQAEISHYFTADPLGHETSLIGFWPFNEGTGTTAANLKSGGPAMTLVGSQMLAANPARAFYVSFKMKSDTAARWIKYLTISCPNHPFTSDFLISVPEYCSAEWQDYRFMVRPVGPHTSSADRNLYLIWTVADSMAGSYFIKDLVIEQANSIAATGSVHAGSQPIYLYEITRGATVWRFANYGADVTCNAQTWSSSDITHGEMTDDVDMAGGELTIKAGSDSATHPFRYFNKREAFLPVTVKVFKIEAGDTTFDTAAPLHSGTVTGSDPGQRGQMTIQISTVMRVGERTVPTVKPGRYCHHRLYSTHCGVVEATYTTAGTVDAIADTYVEVSEFGAKATSEGDPNWFALGKVTVGEQIRLVLGQDGNRLYINAPFDSVIVGNSISASAGCDRRIRTCIDKFNNLGNNLSFPYRPNSNPQLEGLENPQPQGGKK